MLIFWILVFLVSLFFLVKGADWLIGSSEKIGFALGLSPFVIGVTLVAVGTSLPEVISSLFATLKGVTDVAVANAAGSNIANILLIVGIAAIIGKKLVVEKDLVELDLPLLLLSTALFIFVAWDGNVSLVESLILLLAYAFYLFYTLSQREDKGKVSDIPKEIREEKKKIVPKDLLFLLLGILGLLFGAEYLIESLVNLSNILNIGTGVITITAVAFGTSLPELLVSAKAALQKKADVAIGNIFGSNVFNALVVVGLPGLFHNLSVDSRTLLIGLPVLALSTLVFIISGISKKIYIWEGTFFLLLYILFIAKLFNWF